MAERVDAVRTERDFLGDVSVPSRALYGAHTARASRNFPLCSAPVPERLVKSYALVKKACAMANRELGYLPDGVGDAIVQACDELAASVPAEQFPVDALQGGAGTSTNMNVNEVLANMALRIMGRQPGDYGTVHPLDCVNRHQSTNDTYPTALKIACMFAMRGLRDSCAALQGAFQRAERDYAGVEAVGSTERVDAVPMTLGAQFGSFAEAVARDRWRTFKCEERLRVVNLGGTAIGTGMAAPRRYVFLVVDKLREVTGLPIARAENMVEQTANNDAFVEVGGMLAACASDLGKIADDMRLLAMRGDIILPALQAGSSAMPGKVNPVMLEHVIQIGIRTRANVSVIAECASRGSLQICEFMPLLAVSLLETIELLAVGCRRLAVHADGMLVDREACRDRFDRNPAILTALVPDLGYDKVAALAERLKGSGRTDVRAYLEEAVGKAAVDRRLAPEAIMAVGYGDGTP